MSHKAIVVETFGGPEVLQFKTVPTPQPTGNQVLIKIGAAGVNPVDTYIRSGTYARKPELPYTPGSDGAGHIEAVGPNVQKFKVGDRVYLFGASGTYSEKLIALEDHVHHLPAIISFEQGACLGVPYGTAYRGLFQKALVKPRETVLVHGGSGAVGIAAIQLAKAFGNTVIATASSQKGKDLVTQEGAHHVVDHTDSNHFQQILDITKGKGVDVILEMLANVNLGKDLGVLAKGGRVIVIGSRGPVEINARDLMQREAHIIGLALATSSADDFNDIYAGLESGLSNSTLKPRVGVTLPLSDASTAHHNIIHSPSGASGNIVLIP